VSLGNTRIDGALHEQDSSCGRFGRRCCFAVRRQGRREQPARQLLRGRQPGPEQLPHRRYLRQYRIGGISDKSDAFYNLRFGWRWNGIVGAEVGYASLGKAKNDVDYVSTWAKPRVAQIGVTAKYNVYNNWYVTGHGGYLRSHTTAGYTIGDVSNSQKSWNNGWYAGAGVGYDVTKDVSLALNYDNYHVKYGRGGSSQPQDNANVAAYSASVEYRF